MYENIKTGLAVFGAVVIFGNLGIVTYLGIGMFNTRRAQKKMKAPDTIHELKNIWRKTNAPCE